MEHAGRNGHADDLLRLRLASEFITAPIDLGRHIIEESALLFPIDEIRRRNAARLASTICLAHQNELVSVCKRQAQKKNRVNDTENSGVRPNAEREREHGHGGETGIFQQLAEGEFEFVHSAAQNPLLGEMNVAAES